MRNRRGFTLLEIIIVLVILSVVIAIAMPNLRNPGAREAISFSARDLMAASALARQQAISLEAPVQIQFDAEQRRWRIDLPDPDTRKKSRSRRKDGIPESIVERYHELPSRVNISRIERAGEELNLGSKGERLPAVTFYPTGSSDGITVEFTGKDDRKATVAISKSTGRGRSWKGGIEQEFAVANVGQKEETFKRIAQTSEERIASYKGIAARLVADQRRQYEMQQSGLSEAEYYAQKESESEDKP